MAAETARKEPGNATLMAFGNDSGYRLVARFYPALVTVALLLPVSIMLGIPLNGWLVALAAGGGLAVSTAAVALLSQLAAAAGDRLQRKLYPRWPYDSPTNVRLHPADETSSKQQKLKWYAAILRLTGIDIASVASDPKEAERAINDALVILRTKVFYGNKLAGRLDMHNTDYALIRNFTGLRPAWLLTSLASCLGCWLVYWNRQEYLALPVVASTLFVACLLAAFVLESYVRQTAQDYADSFFGALDACDEASQAEQKEKGNGAPQASQAPAAPPPAGPPLAS